MGKNPRALATRQWGQRNSTESDMFGRTWYRAACGVQCVAGSWALQSAASCENAPPPSHVPESELFKPSVPYPYWDSNWDKQNDLKQHFKGRGVSKHIILVRHGQYDETDKEDEKRVLTELGKVQANRTGLRLADMLKAHPGSTLHVSSMTRAKETADIIARHLPAAVRTEPDPLLCEGSPAHTIPTKKYNPRRNKDSERIESAFQKYFHRVVDSPTEEPSHEYEVIVCHGNVIRYLTCRALQLPPEAWLRMCTFNCSLTYLVIRPSGSVSVRALGDIGHLKQEEITFSQHEGFDW